jgi:hypothetical protein
VSKVADRKAAYLHAPLHRTRLAGPVAAQTRRLFPALRQEAGVEDDEAVARAVPVYQGAVELVKAKLFAEPVVVGTLVAVSSDGHLLEVGPAGKHQQKWEHRTNNPAADSARNGQIAYHCTQGISCSCHSVYVLGGRIPKRTRFFYFKEQTQNSSRTIENSFKVKTTKREKPTSPFVLKQVSVFVGKEQGAIVVIVGVVPGLNHFPAEVINEEKFRAFVGINL